MIMKENKIIAEFMGYETYEGVDKVCINLTENNGFSSDWGHVPMKYHSSWDWLMPVLGKIEDLNYELPEDSNLIGDITHGLVSIDIEMTFEAVVQFIKYYNH